MKKALFFILAVLLLSFSMSYAQTMPKLAPTTIGNIFYWDQTNLEILVSLANYNLEDSNFSYQGFNNEVSEKGFMAAHEEENRRYLYMFYFDYDTDEFKQVETVTIFEEEEDVQPYMEELYRCYGFTETKLFHTNFFDQYVRSYDLDFYEVYASDSTVCLIGSAAGEENSMIVMTFCNREYFEQRMAG